MSTGEREDRFPTMTGHPRRIAVSGTYSTGKSTLTEALSLVTGIRRTHALTSREILAEINPDKTVMELNSVELLGLGLRRYEERLTNETGLSTYISDGSVIHEWVYGRARAEVGINPGASLPLRLIKSASGAFSGNSYRAYLDLFRTLVMERAVELYDAYVHLPVEFPMVADHHRPVSEPFRNLSDELLATTVAELDLPTIVARGTVTERLNTVIGAFDLPVVMDPDDAVRAASQLVRSTHEALEADAIRRKADRKSSVVRQIRYAARY